MEIAQVAEIIGRIADGFEEACFKCLEENRGIVYQSVLLQLRAGLDQEDIYLKPTYDDDTYFNEPGRWYKRADKYKAWKKTIDPPIENILGFPDRPDHVPNLYINGQFYDSIQVLRSGDVLEIKTTTAKGKQIVKKYKDRILGIGPTAVEYFNSNYMLPAIGAFFRDCGYK